MGYSSYLCYMSSHIDLYLKTTFICFVAYYIYKCVYFILSYCTLLERQWVNFITLCRNFGRSSLSKRPFINFVSFHDIKHFQPKVLYWCGGARTDTGPSYSEAVYTFRCVYDIVSALLS